MKRSHMLGILSTVMVVSIAAAAAAAPPPTSPRSAAAPLKAMAVASHADSAAAALEERRLQLDERKEASEWRKFQFDFWYRVVLTVVIVLVAFMAFPAIAELAVTLPGGGAVTVRRGEKLPPVHPPGSTVEMPPGSLMVLESLRAKLGNDPAVGLLLSKAEQVRSYAAAGIPGDGIYLCHRVSGRSREGYRRVIVYLDADEPRFLDEVHRVVYHLHPSFPQPTLEVTSRANGFELPISAWGEFMLRGEVTLKTGATIELKRYLNF